MLSNIMIWSQKICSLSFYGNFQRIFLGKLCYIFLGKGKLISIKLSNYLIKACNIGRIAKKTVQEERNFSKHFSNAFAVIGKKACQECARLFSFLSFIMDYV